MSARRHGQVDLRKERKEFRRILDEIGSRCDMDEVFRRAPNKFEEFSYNVTRTVRQEAQEDLLKR